MNKGIQQRFSQSFLRIIRFFDPLQPFKNRCRPVTEGQIRIAFLQLCELPIVLSQWASCFIDLVSTFHSSRSRTNIHWMFCSLLSPQALIRTVPALFIIFPYAICLNPSVSIFFAALISLSCSAPHFGHIHVLTDKSFVSEF